MTWSLVARRGLNWLSESWIVRSSNSKTWEVMSKEEKSRTHLLSACSLTSECSCLQMLPTNPVTIFTPRRYHEERGLWETIRPRGSIFPHSTNMFTEDTCYSSLALLYHMKAEGGPHGYSCMPLSERNPLVPWFLDPHIPRSVQNKSLLFMSTSFMVFLLVKTE